MTLRPLLTKGLLFSSKLASASMRRMVAGAERQLQLASPQRRAAHVRANQGPEVEAEPGVLLDGSPGMTKSGCHGDPELAAVPTRGLIPWLFHLARYGSP